MNAADVRAFWDARRALREPYTSATRPTGQHIAGGLVIVGG